MGDALELVVDDELWNQLSLCNSHLALQVVDEENKRGTYESEHVDEGRQGRDHETVPAPMGLVQQRIACVDRKTGDGEVRDVTEGQFVVSERRDNSEYLGRA